MYRGFNVSLEFEDSDSYEIGVVLNKINKTHVEKTLSNYALNDGSLDGSLMQSNWFPQVNCDIFISHSHKDERLAITLAGWLYDKFKIRAFIDSTIWGYSNNLLKKIDDTFCIQSDGNYNYSKRNNSTSHIHMMLSTALTMMMDKTECLFFLNTPNSITTEQVLATTESPWIYFEISISQLIRKSIPTRILKEESNFFSKAEINEDLKIKYDLSLNHLTEIGISTLYRWMNEHNTQSAQDALDYLYKIKPLSNSQIIHG